MHSRLIRAFALVAGLLAPASAVACTGTENCANGLAFTAFGPTGDTAQVLAVFLHGDMSSGGPADYMVHRARRFAAARGGVVAVALIRPGYFDGRGLTSEGSDNGRRDTYTAGNIRAIEGAIADLKNRFKARKVVMLGHSGGAAIAGVLLGTSKILDGAVLASCPCDVRTWRPRWSSLSPIDYTGSIPAGAPVVAITGAEDSNTLPRYAEAYVARAQNAGKAARYQSVAGGHLFGGALARAALAALGAMAR